jgi:cell division protein ZapA
MAEVKVMVGGRQYAVHCRDGEEKQLHALAEMISERVSKVSGGGGLTETRQLLYAALLLADELTDQRKAQVEAAPAPPPPPPPVPPEMDPAVIAVFERLALRAEALAESLAAQVPSA